MFFLLLLLSINKVAVLKKQNDTLKQENAAIRTGTESIAAELSQVFEDSTDFFILSLIENEGRNQLLEKQVNSLLHQVDSLNSATTELEKAKQKLSRRIEIVRSGSRTADSLLAMSDSLGKQQRELENLRGRITYMQKREGGDGYGPCVPCWLSSEGKAEYLYDLTIFEEWINVQPSWLEHRVAEANEIPNLNLLVGDSLSVAEFHQLAQPILEFSKRNDCRYFVRIEDRAVSKRAFKVRLNAIEGYFCKFLVNPTRDIREDE